MLKRLITVPLFALFIALNVYWFKKHDDLSLYVQLAIVFTSIIVYLMASSIEVFYAKTNRTRIILFKIFVTMLLLYYLAFLSAVLFLDGFFFTRSDVSYVNKIPFETIKTFFISMRDHNNLKSFGNLVGNTMLFAPMGVLLPLFWKGFRNIFVFTITVILMVSGVEIMQYVKHMGTADIDDVILNVAGAIFVFLIFKFVYFLIKDKVEIYFKNDNI